MIAYYNGVFNDTPDIIKEDSKALLFVLKIVGAELNNSIKNPEILLKTLNQKSFECWEVAGNAYNAFKKYYDTVVKDFLIPLETAQASYHIEITVKNSIISLSNYKRFAQLLQDYLEVFTILNMLGELIKCRKYTVFGNNMENIGYKNILKLDDIIKSRLNHYLLPDNIVADYFNNPSNFEDVTARLETNLIFSYSFRRLKNL